MFQSEAGVLDASLTASPRNAADGSPDRSRIVPRITRPAPVCPENRPFPRFHPRRRRAPGSDETVGLLPHAHRRSPLRVSVTAVNMNGVERVLVRSVRVPSRGKATSLSALSGTVSFENVKPGSLRNRSLQWKTRVGDRLSGAHLRPAPFSIVSEIVHSQWESATQAVTVRFTPTTAATSTNIDSLLFDGDNRLTPDDGQYIDVPRSSMASPHGVAAHDCNTPRRPSNPYATDNPLITSPAGRPRRRRIACDVEQRPRRQRMAVGIDDST